MSVQVEKLEHNTAKLTIEVAAEELEKAIQGVYNRQKKSISMPGFRKGKVPRAMVEKMYGAGVFYEDAANDLIPQAYADAAKECGEDIVSRPSIEITQIEKGKPFIFTAEVAVRPEVKLGQYKGVEVTKADTDVTEDEVNAAVDKERENNARIISVEDRAIESGDTAVIDYEGTIDGVAFEGGAAENHPLEIGSGSFIPGFEDQLIGKNIGDETDVNVTFPEDYHSEDLAGKAAVFKVKIHEIKTKEVPELDDDFAQDVSEFDTVAEYKDSVKAKLAEQKEKDVKRAQQDEAIDKIVEASEMDLPELMINTNCENMINQFAQQMAQQGLSLDQYLEFSGTTIDQLKEQVRPEAIERIKSSLVLEQIAKDEQIEITDADVDAEIEKMAESYKMEVEKLKGYMGEEDKENMKKDLAVQRAIDLITDTMVPVEKAEEAPAEEESAE